MYARQSLTLFMSTLLTLSIAFADDHEKEKDEKDVETCGIVFEDVNDNGAYDAYSDVGIPGIHVTVDDGERTVELFTDTGGRFCIGEDNLDDDKSFTVTIDESSFPTNATYLMTVGNNPDVIEEEDEGLGYYGYTITSTTPVETPANPTPATNTAPANNSTPITPGNGTPSNTVPATPANPAPVPATPINNTTPTTPVNAPSANTPPTQRTYRYCVVTQLIYRGAWGRTWAFWSYTVTHLNRPIGTITSQAASFYTLTSAPGTANQKCFGTYTPPAQIIQAMNTQTMIRVW